MDVRFHVFIMLRPTQTSLSIKLAESDLEHLLENDVTLHAGVGDEEQDECLDTTLQVVSEAIRQINDTGNLEQAVAMIYDVERYDPQCRDGYVSQEAYVQVFDSYAMFKQAVAKFATRQLH